MGRDYAGMLGPLAFATVVARGAVGGAGVERTLLTAWLAFWALAAVGYVVGAVAAWVVEQSITRSVAQGLATHDAKPTPATSRQKAAA